MTLHSIVEKPNQIYSSVGYRVNTLDYSPQFILKTHDFDKVSQTTTGFCYRNYAGYSYTRYTPINKSKVSVSNSTNNPFAQSYCRQMHLGSNVNSSYWDEEIGIGCSMCSTSTYIARQCEPASCSSVKKDTIPQISRLEYKSFDDTNDMIIFAVMLSLRTL